MTGGVGCYIVEYPSFCWGNRGKIRIVLFIVIAVKTVELVVHHYPDKTFYVLLYRLYSIIVIYM